MLVAEFLKSELLHGPLTLQVRIAQHPQSLSMILSIEITLVSFHELSIVIRERMRARNTNLPCLRKCVLEREKGAKREREREGIVCSCCSCWNCKASSSSSPPLSHLCTKRTFFPPPFVWDLSLPSLSLSVIAELPKRASTRLYEYLLHSYIVFKPFFLILFYSLILRGI